MRISSLFTQLNEGVSPIVYHFTDFKSAESILKSNTLLSRSGGISFSRSVHGSYPRDHRMIGVIFEIDGNKLNQRYKSSPMGAEELNFDPDMEDYEDEHGFIRTGKGGQLEDMVFSEEIQNIKSMITNVYIYLPKEHMLTDEEDELDGVYSIQLKSLPGVLKELRGFPFTVIDSIRTMGNSVTSARFRPKSYTESIEAIKRLISEFDDPNVNRLFGIKNKTSYIVTYHADGARRRSIMKIESRQEEDIEDEIMDKLYRRFPYGIPRLIDFEPKSG